MQNPPCCRSPQKRPPPPPRYQLPINYRQPSKLRCAAACFKAPPTVPKNPVRRHAVTCFNHWCLLEVHQEQARWMHICKLILFDWLNESLKARQGPGNCDFLIFSLKRP